MQEVKVPDLGGASTVDVIEILVKVGDTIAKDQSIITLESEKASMEVPAPFAGVVKEIKVKVGDKVSENSLLLMAETSTNEKTAEKPVEKNKETKVVTESVAPKISIPKSAELQVIKVPDLGGSKNVDVIELLVKPGDVVQKDTSLITLEGEKASMEVPSPIAGTIKELKVAIGNKVNEGDVILLMQVENIIAATTIEKPATIENVDTAKAATKTTPIINVEKSLSAGEAVHAGPAVRRLAREFGVELKQVKGTGEKGRILKENVQQYVKNILTKPSSLSTGVGLNIVAAPKVDFSKFGITESKPLSKIKRLTGINTHRSWVTIPHVTQFDEADITELEEFRNAKKVEAEKKGYKLTPLVFLMKAIVKCLQSFPNFNASLDETGENLILKKYFHIGVAVDTPNGLVVPVIHDVDQKSLYELSKELAEISKKAREKGLTLNEMSGSCFTISSLGGIGGTAFTPIVNAPDVAILGVSKSQMKPSWNGKEFLPRLMLPLSLSYDHRVIDGAEAARFITLLSKVLGDIRELLL